MQRFWGSRFEPTDSPNRTCWTGPSRSSPRFSSLPEPNHKSGSGFRQSVLWTGPNRTAASLRVIVRSRASRHRRLAVASQFQVDSERNLPQSARREWTMATWIWRISKLAWRVDGNVMVQWTSWDIFTYRCLAYPTTDYRSAGAGKTVLS